MDLGLQGRRALITGASQGIGREVSLRLAEEGAAVALVARRAAVLEEVAAEALKRGAKAAIVAPADLSASVPAAAAVELAVRELGGLDILVNNVGAARQTSVHELTDEDWLASFQINLMSYVRVTSAALPHLRASEQARIVNVASTAGKRPSGGIPDYSVMKAGVLSYSRLIADAEAGNGVLVNAVAPGPTGTPAWLAPGGMADQAAVRSGVSRDDVLAKLAAGRPIGRIAEPREIADVIVFLCSARTSYVTGAAWGVDGGTVPVII